MYLKRSSTTSSAIKTMFICKVKKFKHDFSYAKCIDITNNVINIKNNCQITYKLDYTIMPYALEYAIF